MRVGIYDAYWKTLGGGEKLAASYAEAIQDIVDVTLLAHEPVDLGALAAHLDLDLRRVSVRVIEEGESAVVEASGDFDVFVNCSFLASYPAASSRSFFVAMFPDRPAVEPTPALEVLVGLRDVVLPQANRLHLGSGFFPEESDGDRSWRWTGASAQFGVHPISDGGFSLWLTLDGSHRPADASREVLIDIDGTVHRRLLDVSGPRTFVFLVDPAPGHSVSVGLSVEPFEIEGDPRTFGVQVLGVDVERPAYTSLAAQILDVNHTFHARAWADSYDAVVSISEFTRYWVEQYWGRQSLVVYPSVRPRPPAPKERVILSVGRFFEHAGHSKKQRELVAAFRLLAERPEAAGWQLWLMGGAVDPAYVDSVRTLADELPVRIIENASGGDVANAFGRASLYWHGMGLGERPDRDPIMFEHFGISIVEAMSAGAVPLVVDAGGQAEIVQDGVNGLHFDSITELVEQTALLLRYPEVRRGLADAAVERAKEFGPEPFRHRVLKLIGITS